MLDPPDRTAAISQDPVWIFDLDNTLYPASAGLFAQVEARMGAFVGQRLGRSLADARSEQKRLFQHYGTTLRGLMQEHGIDPKSYLAFVHDIDYAVLAPAPELAAGLARLPGRRLIYTNASRRHAQAVLDQLGIPADLFERIWDIADSDFVPKPDPAAFTAMLAACHAPPDCAVFFDDQPRNIATARALGLATVWVGAVGECPPAEADVATTDLARWLAHATLPARRDTGADRTG